MTMAGATNNSTRWVAPVGGKSWSVGYANSAVTCLNWDFADAGSGDEQIWLTYYASKEERQAWVHEFRDVVLPARRRPPYCRDHRLPQSD